MYINSGQKNGIRRLSLLFRVFRVPVRPFFFFFRLSPFCLPSPWVGTLLIAATVHTPEVKTPSKFQFRRWLSLHGLPNNLFGKVRVRPEHDGLEAF